MGVGLGLGLGLGLARVGVRDRARARVRNRGWGQGLGIGAAHRTCVALTKEAGVAARPPNLHSRPPPRVGPSTGAKWEPVTSMRVPAVRGPSSGVSEVRVGGVVPSEVVKTTASSSTAPSAENE